MTGRSLVQRGRATAEPPPKVSRFRHLFEALGLALLIATVLLALAMVTYDSADPSANMAVDAVPHNILGRDGAWLVDWLFRLFGLAAALLPAVLLIWSVRLLLGRGLAWFWLRVPLVAPGIAFAALALAALPTPGFWPLRKEGLGGLVGRLAKANAAATAPSWLLALVAAGLAVALLLYIAGFPVDDWSNVEPMRRRRQARSEHRGLSLGWALAPLGWMRALWAAARAGRAEDEDRHALAPPRREPSLADGVSEVADEEEGDDEEMAAAPLPRRQTVPVVAPKQGKRKEPSRQTTLDLGPADRHLLPPLDLLAAPPPAKFMTINEEGLQQNARLL